MSSTQPPAPGALSGAVMMYQRPEPLNPEQHGGLGLVRTEKPWRFAARAHAVPLQVTEFGPASLSYPVIFAGESYTPLAILSLRADENLFVSADGTYDPECYIPGFIRRYPFVLANDEAQGRLVVCIDRAADFIRPEGEVRLFENGRLSEYAQGCIKFCEDFEGERVRTEQFVKTLRELDLLESTQSSYTPRDAQGVAGEPVQIADYYAVSSAKLDALPVDKLAELRGSGALQQIYAHLNSLFGWDRLIARTSARTAQG